MLGFRYFQTIMIRQVIFSVTQNISLAVIILVITKVMSSVTYMQALDRLGHVDEIVNDPEYVLLCYRGLQKEFWLNFLIVSLSSFTLLIGVAFSYAATNLNSQLQTTDLVLL